MPRSVRRLPRQQLHSSGSLFSRSGLSSLCGRRRGQPGRGGRDLQMLEQERLQVGRITLARLDVQAGNLSDNADADFTAAVVDGLCVFWMMQEMAAIGEGATGHRTAEEHGRVVPGDQAAHVAISAEFLTDGAT